MTLHASGPMSMSQIAVEFVNTTPYSMSEFYKGGGLVPDSVGNVHVPSAGAISFSDMYLATNIQSRTTTRNTSNTTSHITTYSTNFLVNEPVTGYNYQTSGSKTYWLNYEEYGSATVTGQYVNTDMYWNNAKVTWNLVGPHVTAYVHNGWTYYRGSQQNWIQNIYLNQNGRLFEVRREQIQSTNTSHLTSYVTTYTTTYTTFF